MRQNETAEIGHLDRVIVSLAALIGKREQGQRHLGTGVPERLDRSELGRLVPACIEAMLIADEHLQRHEHGQ